MGPITYSLCQKPVIGMVMWITSLCAFPPLIKETNVSLENPGKIMSSNFIVAVDKNYFFDISFTFPSTEARIKDGIGDCKPMRFRIFIRDENKNTVAVDQVFQSQCVSSHISNKKWRTIGSVNLPKGKYFTEIYNIEPQPGFEEISTAISLVAGHGK